MLIRMRAASRRARLAPVVASVALVPALLVSGCTQPGRVELPGARPVRGPASIGASAEGAGSCGDAVYARLDGLGPARKYAQLIMVGVPADGVDAAARAALRRGPGGVILTGAARGAPASRSSVRSTVDNARSQAGDAGLLVSTDQEGGRVQQLDGPDFEPIPPAVAQGANPASLQRHAADWAAQLHEAGVDVDLAPVADVVDPNLGVQNAPVGRFGRQFGTDVGTVARAVPAFVSGMLEGGVVPTLKHFPGLGRVRENTDLAEGVADSSTGRADLEPFRVGIEAGAPLVMMSSATYTRLDPDHMALFSPTIMQDILRRDLSFDGVIMTDDVGVAKALEGLDPGRRATDFVAAGGNLVLTVRAADLGAMVDAMVARANGDLGFRQLADDSVRRVLALKEARTVTPCR